MDINRSVAMYKQQKKTYHNFLIFGLMVFQFIGIFLSILKNEKLNDITIYFSMLFILFSFLSNYFLPKITKGDITFILIVNLLYSLSIIMMLRVSSYSSLKHILWYVAGTLTFVFINFAIKYIDEFLKNKFWMFFSLTLISFIITLTLGFSSGGAKNWISVGKLFTIQLSEFAKIGYVFMIATYYNNYDAYENKTFGKYYLVLSTYLFSALFFLQGELGTALLLFITMLGTMFIFEKRYKFIIANILSGLVGIYLASFVLPHIKVRIDIWINPWADPNGRGYQIIQGLFAVANGGFFGSGIGLGRPELIPVVESDYIIAAIIEEMGILIGFSVILLYIIIFYKSVKVSLQLKSKYYSSLALSIGLLFAVQTLIILGGILKLIPLTGITTPFLSYGGSSTVVNFILLAILQYLTSKSGDGNGY